MDNRSLITLAEHSREKLLYLIEMAQEFEKHPNRKLLEGRIAATLFFEPSTRTRLSFETAANRLGAKVIGFADPKVTSGTKGEILKDTIKMVSNYADIIIMRHYLEGAAKQLIKYPLIPCNDCKYCMPCPYGLDIPGIFVHYNKCVNEGVLPGGEEDANYSELRRNYLISYNRAIPTLRQADHCVNCNKCTPHCPQNIKIPKELQNKVLTCT